MSLVNKDRLVNEFIELTKIDSITLDERNIADSIKLKLMNMGISSHEDDAGKKIGGNAGNIICRIKGKKDVPEIMLMAHMDTVVPGKNKKPVVEGNIIKTDGTTILGGDDIAGVACILEVLRILNENDIEHGDIQVIFTVAEEGGLFGAKNLEYDKITAKYGFVLDDGGKIGHVVLNAPAQDKIDVLVRGKAAHAGIEPENGISAISIASHAITKMKLGRIDNETTANVGVITGGSATNIICDSVKIKAEARSRNEDKLKNQTSHMMECFLEAAEIFGGSVEFKSSEMYPSFNIDRNSNIVAIVKEAAKRIGLEPEFGSSGGGSDTNILNKNGISSVNLSIGMTKVHSVEEQICIDDMLRVTEFVVSIVESVM